jgi:hypothetical protein
MAHTLGISFYCIGCPILQIYQSIRNTENRPAAYSTVQITLAYPLLVRWLPPLWFLALYLSNWERRSEGPAKGSRFSYRLFYERWKDYGGCRTIHEHESSRPTVGYDLPFSASHPRALETAYPHPRVRGAFSDPALSMRRARDASRNHRPGSLHLKYMRTRAYSRTGKMVISGLSR